ncbi:hypothetical protein ACTXT7_005358 [Hymenolepis weldensis]
MADPRVLTNLNIINHAPMPFYDNCSCPLATQSIIMSITRCVNSKPVLLTPLFLSGRVFFGSITSCTVLNFRPINTSTGDFTPNVGCGIDLHPSRKFCSTSSIVLSPFAFSYRRISLPVHSTGVVRRGSDVLDQSLLTELLKIDGRKLCPIVRNESLWQSDLGEWGSLPQASICRPGAQIFDVLVPARLVSVSSGYGFYPAYSRMA